MRLWLLIGAALLYVASASHLKVDSAVWGEPAGLDQDYPDTGREQQDNDHNAQFLQQDYPDAEVEQSDDFGIELQQDDPEMQQNDYDTDLQQIEGDDLGEAELQQDDSDGQPQQEDNYDAELEELLGDDDSDAQLQVDYSDDGFMAMLQAIPPAEDHYGLAELAKFDKLPQLQQETGEDDSGKLQQDDSPESDEAAEVEEDEMDKAYETKIEALLQELEKQQEYDEDNAQLQQDDEGGEDNLVDVEQDDEKEPSEEEMEALLQQDNEDGDSLFQQGEDGANNINDEMALEAQDGNEEGGEGTAVAQWNNRWDGPLRVVCSPGQGLYGVRSVHSNSKQDRLFSWYCKKVYQGTEQLQTSATAQRSRYQRLRRYYIRIYSRHYSRYYSRYYRAYYYKYWRKWAYRVIRGWKLRLHRVQRHYQAKLRKQRNYLSRVRRHYTLLIRRQRANLIRYTHRQKASLIRRYRILLRRQRYRLIKSLRRYRHLLRRTRRRGRVYRRRYLHYRRRFRRIVRRWRRMHKKRNYNRHVGCFWKKVNTWDRPMNYRCPSNYYLAGVSSRHDNRKEDREWNAYCCRTPGICTRSCRWTGYINKLDGPMNYRTGGIMAGLISYHDNRKEDRRWRIRSCTMRKCRKSRYC